MYNQSGLKKIVNTALVNLTYNTESDRLIDPVKYVLSMGILAARCVRDDAVVTGARC